MRGAAGRQWAAGGLGLRAGALLLLLSSLLLVILDRRAPAALWRVADPKPLPRVPPRAARPGAGRDAGAVSLFPAPGRRPAAGAGPAGGPERLTHAPAPAPVFPALLAIASAAIAAVMYFWQRLSARPNPVAMFVTFSRNKRKSPEKIIKAAAKYARLEEIRQRTVVLGGCPLAATRENLHDAFPDAQKVYMLPRKGPPFNGRCLLVYSSPEEAQVTARDTEIKVMGKWVVARLAAADKEAASREERRRTVIFTGLSPTTTPQRLQEQFPNGESFMHLWKYENGPLSGRGFVTFFTVEEAEAVVYTPGLEIDGQPVQASFSGDRDEYELDRRRRTVVLVEPPLVMTHKDMNELFPNVEIIAFLKKRRVFLTFPTTREAREVADKEWLVLMGKDVRVKRAVYMPRRKLKKLVKPVRIPKTLKSILVSDCPSTVSAPQLQQLFPNSTEVVLQKNPGGPSAYRGRTFLVVFSSMEEADQAVRTASIEVDGHPLSVDLAIPPHERPTLPGPITELMSLDAIRKKQAELKLWKRRARTVVLSRCPLNLTMEDLRWRFPEAQTVQLCPRDGPFSGRCTVLFYTEAEARETALMKRLELNGQHVLVRKADVKSEVAVARERVRSVVLSGVPLSMTAEQLWRAFPTAEAILMKARWKGGPFNGRCLLAFSSVEEAQAMAAKGWLEVDGNWVQAQVPADPEKYNHAMSQRCVVLAGCPLSITEAEVGDRFPAAQTIRLLADDQNGESSCRCLLIFPTVAEADEVLRLTEVELQGQPVSVHSAQFTEDDVSERVEVPAM